MTPAQLTSRPDVSRRRLLTLLLIPVLLGGSILLVSTAEGLGIGDDSVIYLGAARNLVAGDGLSRLEGDGSPVPVTHYPPGYPLSLAGWVAAGVSVEAGARALALLALAISVLFVGLLAWELTGSTLLSLFPALLFAISPVTLEISSWVMSEPHFVALTLIASWSLARFLQTERARFLYASALCVAFAWLTRYIGYTVLATALLALAVQRKPWQRRLGEIVAYGLVAAAPISLWLARNLALTGSATNRQLAWHPVGMAKLRSGLAAAAEWIYAGQPPATWMAIPAMIVLLFVHGMYLSTNLPKRAPPHPRVARDIAALSLSAFTALYLISLLLSISLFDYSTPIDRRILFPVYPIALVVGAGALHYVWPHLAKLKWLRFATVAVLVAGLARYSWETVETIGHLRRDARGFAASVWQESEAAAYLRDLPSETAIYTNEPVAVYYLADRGSYIVPIRFDSVVGRAREDYEASLAEMRARLHSGEAVLALLNSISFQTDFAPEEVMTEGLTVIAEGPRMRIFAPRR